MKEKNPRKKRKRTNERKADEGQRECDMGGGLKSLGVHTMAQYNNVKLRYTIAHVRFTL